MNTYGHHVVGFFSHRIQAEKTFSRVVTQGVFPRFVRIYDKYSVLPISLSVSLPAPLSLAPSCKTSTPSVSIINEEGGGVDDEKHTWTSVNLDSLIGTGLGNLLGIKLIAANVSLIVEPSLVTSLVSLGWGTNIGVVGKSFYNREDDKFLSDLVHDAILSRQIVLVVETNSPEETAAVSEILQVTTGNLARAI